MKWFIAIFILLTIQAQARVEVLFHPHDPTLEKIATWINEAKSTVDIAMYNMDTSIKSPVIKLLSSSDVQNRLKSQDLKIRLLFEGYGTPTENQQKMQDLEDLNVDVRFLGKSVKVHHKMAIIDAHGPKPRVISGSANWSLSSYHNYDENILFFENESAATYRFNLEFSRLWIAAKEFGMAKDEKEIVLPKQEQKDFAVYFNSPKRIDPTADEPSEITPVLVDYIDSAESELVIATTRIRINSVLEALLRAAKRGVHIKIVISQDDYKDLQKRSHWLLENQNIEVRVKFYNLRVSQYMLFQMHNKFMIVDGKTVLSGSFNWSDSSENNHIENLIVLSGTLAKEVLEDFTLEFTSIWSMNRVHIQELMTGFQQSEDEGHLPKCPFTPTVFTIDEIDNLLLQFPKCS